MEIRTEALTKIYSLGSSRITALDDVSFEVNERAFTAIIGRSGSGKSTLLSLIGLNDVPTSGRVLVDDKDVSKLSGGERRKIRLHRMGFVFQTFNLLPTLNATENVELPMSLAGKTPKEQREKATKLLETVSLGNRVLHRPKQLSLGEMQRVAIARALANDPEVIIADEPTGELDSKTAKEVIALLLGINREKKKTVIVATHDEKIVEMADIVYTIEDGRLSFKS
jgi:putative ABC transport system ATP-binding protein